MEVCEVWKKPKGYFGLNFKGAEFMFFSEFTDLIWHSPWGVHGIAGHATFLPGSSSSFGTSILESTRTKEVLDADGLLEGSLMQLTSAMINPQCACKRQNRE